MHFKEKINLDLDKRRWRPSPLFGQVVLVTTCNSDGTSNLAPKSWISMISFDPPRLVLGCNEKHWTAANILRSKEFVVNVPSKELVKVVWESHLLPHPRPIEAVGLTAVPATKVIPPRIEECRAHLECTLVDRHFFGQELLIIGRIVAVSVDRDAFVAADPYSYLQSFVFLENNRYGVIERSEELES